MEWGKMRTRPKEAEKKVLCIPGWWGNFVKVHPGTVVCV